MKYFVENEDLFVSGLTYNNDAHVTVRAVISKVNPNHGSTEGGECEGWFGLSSDDMAFCSRLLDLLGGEEVKSYYDLS